MNNILKTFSLFQRKNLRRICVKKLQTSSYFLNQPEIKDPNIKTTIVFDPSNPGSSTPDPSKSQNETILEWMKKSKMLSPISISLLFACGLCFITILYGGKTRRMKAGLSMTTWNFFHEIYPQTFDEWMEEFDRYKEIPEYKLSDQTMSLDEFKQIYKYEFNHRILGRITGLTVILASTVMLLKGARSDVPRAIIYNILILAQGLLGWYMVKSGFSEDTFNSPENPTVSPYRLSSHNMLACILLALMFHRFISGLKLAENLTNMMRPKYFSVAYTFGHITTLLYVLTMGYGSLLSGTHAILVHNTYPSMSGKTVPHEMWELTPTWRNLFENQTTVQFTHRQLAHVTAISASILAYFMVRTFGHLPPQLKFPFWLTIVGISAQIPLGVVSLITLQECYRFLHQFNSVQVLCFLMWMTAEMAKIKRGKI